jgi:hypothetical protein
MPVQQTETSFLPQILPLKEKLLDKFSEAQRAPDARHQATEKVRDPFGGALNTATVLRVFSKAWRYLRGGPFHFLMYTLGRFGAVRSLVLFAYRRRRRSRIAENREHSVESIDIESAADAVARDGFFTGLRLRPQVLRALRLYAKTTTCCAEESFRFPFRLQDRAAAERRYGKKIGVGRLDNALQDCPELLALASDPMLLAIARKYFGCEPTFLGSRIWWSFATDAEASQQMSMGQGWHYDLDGYRALAFFFYLTDVDSSTGPHILIRGSHTQKPWKSLVSLHKGRSDAEITKWYGKERHVTICGPAGSGFAEDIFCFHKGLHPKQGERLVLQLRYGIYDYGKTAGVNSRSDDHS